MELGATLTPHSSTTISWQASPTGFGTLSPATGDHTEFLASTVDGGGQLVTVTATAGSLTATATIQVEPLPTDAGNPLGAGRYTILNRVDQVETVGVSAANSADNLMVLGSASAYGVTSTTAYSQWQNSGSSTQDPVYLDLVNSNFDQAPTKLAHAANLDDDAPDETVILSWQGGQATVGAASAQVSILDPTPSPDGGAPAIQVLNPTLVDAIGNPVILAADPSCNGGTSLAWESSGCTLAFDYDFVLADVDGDGYADLVITGTVAAPNSANTYSWGYSAATNYRTEATPPIKAGMLWVFKSMHASQTATSHQLVLMNSIRLSGSYQGNSNYSGLYSARVAAGSMNPDRSVQIAVGWIGIASWLNLWSQLQQFAGGGPSAVATSAAPTPISYALFQGSSLSAIGSTQSTDPSFAVLQDASAAAPWLNLFQMVMADVDGDGTQELVFAGMNVVEPDNAFIPSSFAPGATGNTVFDLVEVHGNLSAVRVDAGEDPAALPILGEFASQSNIDNYPTTSIYVPALTPTRWLATVNNSSAPNTSSLPAPGGSNPPASVILGNQLVAFPASGSGYPLAPTVVENIVPGTTYYSNASSGIIDIQAGDLNGDGFGDAIVLDHTGAISAYGWICQDSSVPCDNDGWQQFYSYASTSGQTVYGSLLVPASLDNHSIVVEPLDLATSVLLSDGGVVPVSAVGPAHSIVYKNPQILALLEAPPSLPNSGQDPGLAQTVYTTSTTSGMTTGTSFDLSFGITVGFEQDSSVGAIISENLLTIRDVAVFNFEQSFAWDRTQSTTYSAAYGTSSEDLVVYASTPYDRYIYSVVSAPSPSVIGSLMTVDVPMATVVSTCDINYFNTVVNPTGLQITTGTQSGSVLPDTPGDLTSYPPSNAPIPSNGSVEVGNGATLTSKITALCQTNPSVAVGENSTDFTTVSCGIASGSSHSSEQSFSVDNEFEAQVLVVVAGFSVGVGGSHEMSWDHEQSLTFQGQVGNLPLTYADGGADYAVNEYNWAIAGYEEELDNAAGKPVQDFFVVGYGVSSGP